MLFDLSLLFLAFILSILLYPAWIWFVYKFHMGESIRSDGPESHEIKRGTPTMGGLVFIVVVALVTFSLNQSRTQTLFPVLVALLAGLFGLIEDFSKVYKKSGLPSFFVMHFPFLRNLAGWLIFKPFTLIWGVFKEFARTVGSSHEGGLHTSHKFLIQGGIAGFVAYWMYFKLGWDFIWFPLIGDVHIGIFYPIFVFFVFMGILNFVAFTDGLDGLAGGLGIIAFGAYWVIASALGYNSLAGYLATFIGAMLPFLYFNVYPARIFMGNVGSHVLGATLAILGFILHRELAMLIILVVFLADGVSSPLQQLSVKLTRKRLFLMAPIHHHFEVLGWPETKVTFRFWILGIGFAFLGILISLL